AEGDLAAAGLLQGAPGELPRDLEAGGRHRHRARRGRGDRAQRPRPRVRVAMGEGSGPRRTRPVNDHPRGAKPMENTELNFWTLIQQGAISTYPLLICSIVVVAIAFERAWSLRGVIASAAALVRQVAPALSRGDVAAAQGTL